MNVHETCENLQFRLDFYKLFQPMFSLSPFLFGSYCFVALH